MAELVKILIYREDTNSMAKKRVKMGTRGAG